MKSEIITFATLTCPNCGYKETLEMPANACQHFYRCKACSIVMRPKPGDCCVFCSYADVKCPPKQLEAAGEDSELRSDT
ncbi:MAG: hypothetical protein M1469_11025 [Bacteroidetes bacterium]|nr:hypothetical protein [Bacteroidota bacterium]